MNGEIDHRCTRRDFTHGVLRRKDLSPDPVVQFAHWLKDAETAGNFDPTAMALATVSPDGRPSVRLILLKHFDRQGLCWYTDTRSPKGRDIAANPHAAVVFYWPENDRQVRVEGVMEALPEADAEAYFQSRPVGSRFAAAASLQSAPIEDRAALEARVAALRAQYPDGAVPRNPAWGGYRLIPDRFEFWQGRENRMHDRFLYTREGDGWRIQRLMP